MRRMIALVLCSTACARPLPHLDLVPLRVPSPLDVRTQLSEFDDSSTTLLRSASRIVHARQPPGFQWIAPELLLVGNNGFPYSANDRSLWAGRGTSALGTAGAVLRVGSWTAIIAPQVAYTRNRIWVPFQLPDFYGPVQYPDRSLLSAPWYRLPYSVDAPWRFGERAFSTLDAGQSTIRFDPNPRIAVGVSTENEWWGPGIRNALLLSSNAPGFPHAFLGTSSPWPTRFGLVEARLVLGGLSESPYFDTVSTNNLRSLSGLMLAWRRDARSSLELGLARLSIATTSSWSAAIGHALDALRPTTPPRFGDSTDIAGRSGRDAMTSAFLRWGPGGGVSVHAEIARLAMPSSLQDAILAPNYTRGYTAGIQWTSPEGTVGRWHSELELTNLEQEATTLSRPGFIWYTSSRVSQGFTQRGQILGAAIGPSGSSQWLAADYMRDRWRLGVTVQRIRWNNDALYTYFAFPGGSGWCENDVTLAPGLRGDLRTRWGRIATEFQAQNRMNYFFQNASGCPRGNAMRDLRNLHMLVRWVP